MLPPVRIGLPAATAIAGILLVALGEGAARGAGIVLLGVAASGTGAVG